MDIEFKNRFSRKMQILFYLLLKNYTFIFLNYAYNLIYKFLQHIHSIYIFFIHYNKYYYCTLDFNFPLNLYFEHIYIYILWGRRIWQARPISYQTQGPRRERRNVWGWVRKAQAAGRHRRGPSCPRPTKVTERESSTPLKTALPVVLNKRTNTVGQLWGHDGGAILGEAVIFALNIRSW